MRLATWNVNSLKVRLPHLVEWLARASPDVACLQETKIEDANFPLAELRAAFATVKATRPEATRKGSAETYVLAASLRKP